MNWLTGMQIQVCPAQDNHLIWEMMMIMIMIMITIIDDEPFPGLVSGCCLLETLYSWAFNKSVPVIT
jgi:hypothetical protein